MKVEIEMNSIPNNFEFITVARWPLVPLACRCCGQSS
jgi:hypothetical protein